ncbi:MAG: hypothetical protein ABJE10_19405 [bacterium]
MLRWLVGTPLALPDDLLARYPELGDALWRRGGIPLRIGGWSIGRPTVSGITLWRTVFIATQARLDPELLLHELRHVHQFEADPFFPLRYVWRSVRHGYTDNPYEADARAYAAHRLADAHPTA